MPVGLGLEIPSWDDGDVGLSMAAQGKPGLKKTKGLQKKAVKQAASARPDESSVPQHSAAGRAPANGENVLPRHDVLRPKSASDAKKKRGKARPIESAAELEPAVAGKSERWRDEETSQDGARKRKKRKGKHGKNKMSQVDALTASTGTNEDEGCMAQGRSLGAADSTSGQEQGGDSSKRAKKRKRKNKFRGESEPDDHNGSQEVQVVEASARKKKKGGKEMDRQEPKAKGGDEGRQRKHAEHTQQKQKKKQQQSPLPPAEDKTADGDGDDKHDKFPFKDMGAVAKNRRLTPLQAKLAGKLEAAHFRMLNEELYTTPSSAAVDMFGKEPWLFETYHQGFRRQTLKWPVNPVDVILKFLNKHPKWKIADLGCGDAKIAHSLADGRVHSFDLVSVNSKVTACDIAKVPLAADAVDAVVLSLALMGTNYAAFLKEANRIVKTGGRVLIAEVRSRCEHVLEQFLSLLEALGFKVDEVDKGNKMFIMFYLTKVRNAGKVGKLAAPELKACQYKKR